MRYNDVRDGTNVAGEVIEKYRKAWDKKGMVAPDGLYVDWLYFNQDKTVAPSGIIFTAWSSSSLDKDSSKELS